MTQTHYRLRCGDLIIVTRSMFSCAVKKHDICLVIDVASYAPQVRVFTGAEVIALYNDEFDVIGRIP